MNLVNSKLTLDVVIFCLRSLNCKRIFSNTICHHFLLLTMWSMLGHCEWSSTLSAARQSRLFTDGSLSRLGATSKRKLHLFPLRHLSFSSILTAILISASTPNPQPRPPTLTLAGNSATNPGPSGTQPHQVPRFAAVSSILRNLRPVPRSTVGAIGGATSRPPPSLVIAPRLQGPVLANPAGLILLTARKFLSSGNQEGYMLVCPPRMRVREEHLGQASRLVLLNSLATCLIARKSPDHC